MKNSILYDRILGSLKDSDTSLSLDINNPSKSLKGVLLIFTKERSATKFERDTEEVYNPKITKVEVTVEGSSKELYAQNMEYRQHYEEIIKHFGEGRLKVAGAIQKDLQLHDVNTALYYTDKFALWLDFQTIDDNTLHGSGRRLENISEGVRLQIMKEAGSAGKLSCYLFLLINISDAQVLNVLYQSYSVWTILKHYSMGEGHYGPPPNFVVSGSIMIKFGVLIEFDTCSPK